MLVACFCGSGIPSVTKQAWQQDTRQRTTMWKDPARLVRAQPGQPNESTKHLAQTPADRSTSGDDRQGRSPCPLEQDRRRIR